MAKPPADAPWAPPDYEDSDVASIQALVRGEATEDQQQRAFKYIVERVCNTYDLSYRPGSDRDTAFAEGRRFCGLQLVKLSKLNLKVLSDGRRSTGGRT